MVKNIHLKMDFVVCLASERIFLVLALIHALYKYEWGLQVLGWYPWTKIMPFLTNICFNLASDRAICSAPYGIFIAKSTPRIAPEWSFILVKISRLTMDFVVLQASDRIILGLGPQLCII